MAKGTAAKTSKKASKKTTSKKTSKKATKKTTTKKAPEPEVQEEESTGPCVADFLDAIDQLDEMRKEITVVKHRFQALAKYASKLEKQVNKIEQKKAERAAKNGGKPRARGGIMKKALISDELCDFLGVDKGTELTRNDVRNMINTYAKDNDLKEGTQITLDKDLSSLFPDVDGDTLAYNAIIGQLRPHFPQSETS